MAETIKPTRSIWKILLWILVPILLIALLGGLYILGNLSVAPMMRAAYNNKNCAEIQKWDQIANTFYPATKRIYPELDGYVNECSAYSAAHEKFVSQSWEEAHSAYEAFEAKYANDKLANDAHQEHGQVITEVARARLAAGQFQDATDHANLVLANYADTPSKKDANLLIPEIIVQWGASYRQNQEFVSAEAKFKELDAWARANASQEYVNRSKNELAQTYLTWAQTLEAQEKYTEAIEKYETAAKSDPEPQRSDSPAAQAMAAIPKIHIKWGDGFLAQNKYSDAFAHYQKAADLSKPEEQPAIKDMIARGYHQWTDQLIEEKNFIEALNKADQAQQAAGTDALKKELEGMRNEIFTTFSNSSGAQVEAAMNDISKQVCEQGKPYKYPIFGIDPNNKQFLLYGVETRLPADMLAKTPGAAHYIVCIEIQTKVIETRKLPTLYYGYLVYNEALGLFIQMAREQYTWNVTVRNTQTGEIVKQNSFTGSLPPPLPRITMANAYSIVSGGHYQRYRGNNPDFNQIVAWLKTLVE